MNAFLILGSTMSSTVRVIFYALGALVFVLLLAGGYNIWRSLPLGAWQAPAFELRGGEFGAARPSREVLTTGPGQRLETLSFGTPSDAGEFLEVSFMTAHTDEAASRPFAMRRGAKSADQEFLAIVNGPSGRRWEIDTRYGVMDAFDVPLDVNGRRRICVTFRSRHGGPVLVEGRHCPQMGQSPQPSRAACLVHAVRAVRPLGYPALDAALAGADASTRACTARPISAADLLRRGF
ncbi:hypothetical protein [Salinarimonas soli]|uniref:Uncharacterized protein n=1 Tax=Salinarimonas soli TaxID=1638099 RepID=A0A5B2VF73_9HYPH|nr:hypothetical protein [Salinarimonas soli]KAA2237090.1 hypothetical protein F0L46_11550 [Salinarimonas soli]